MKGSERSERSEEGEEGEEGEWREGVNGSLQFICANSKTVGFDEVCVGNPPYPSLRLFSLDSPFHSPPWVMF